MLIRRIVNIIIALFRSSSYISPSPVRDQTVQLSDKAIEKQSELSAKAKAVFEESLRQYESSGPVKESPPPLPPKTDRPPLPPKQRSSRRGGAVAAISLLGAAVCNSCWTGIQGRINVQAPTGEIARH